MDLLSSITDYYDQAWAKFDDDMIEVSWIDSKKNRMRTVRLRKSENKEIEIIIPARKHSFYVKHNMMGLDSMIQREAEK